MDDFTVADDGFDASDVTDCIDSISTKTCVRLGLLLAVAYAIISFMAWQEYRFSMHGLSLIASAELVGRTKEGNSVVRYTFRDPVTMKQCRNTTTVAEDVQIDAEVEIQFIAGDLAQSRLASQARPGAVVAFWVMTSTLPLGMAIVFVLARREMDRKPLGRYSARRITSKLNSSAVTK
jgi:hypothetical protein